jgi:hypothetical protein
LCDACVDVVDAYKSNIESTINAKYDYARATHA